MGHTFGGEARVRGLEVIRSAVGIHERDVSEEVMGGSMKDGLIREGGH